MTRRTCSGRVCSRLSIAGQSDANECALLSLVSRKSRPFVRHELGEELPYGRVEVVIGHACALSLLLLKGHKRRMHNLL